MSVIVIGMEMPTSCDDCPLGGSLHCQVLPGVPALVAEYNNAITEKRLHSHCPLVLVPEHGDLIDRGEMFEEFVIEGQKSTRYKIGERWELNGEEIRRVIANLPAVITAEESK